MYNDISLCVNEVQSHPESIVAACKFAERISGTVTAIYLRPNAAEIVRWQGSSPMDLANQMLVDTDKREASAKQQFEEVCADFDIKKYGAQYQLPNSLFRICCAVI